MSQHITSKPTAESFKNKNVLVLGTPRNDKNILFILALYIRIGKGPSSLTLFFFFSEWMWLVGNYCATTGLECNAYRRAKAVASRQNQFRTQQNHRAI